MKKEKRNGAEGVEYPVRKKKEKSGRRENNTEGEGETCRGNEGAGLNAEKRKGGTRKKRTEGQSEWEIEQKANRRRKKCRGRWQKSKRRKARENRGRQGKMREKDTRKAEQC